MLLYGYWVLCGFVVEDCWRLRDQAADQLCAPRNPQPAEGLGQLIGDRAPRSVARERDLDVAFALDAQTHHLVLRWREQTSQLGIRARQAHDSVVEASVREATGPAPAHDRGAPGRTR